MKKNTLICIIAIICIQNYLMGQVIKSSNLILGSEIRGTVYIPANNNVDFPNITVFTFIPHLDFKVKRNIFLGLNYESTFGNVEGQKLTPIQAMGIQAKLFHGHIFKDRLFQNHVLFNTELNWKRANYYLDPQKPFGYDKLSSFSNNIIDISFNLNFRLYKSMYITTGYRYLYYTYNDYGRIGPRLGLQYHFNEQRNHIPQKQYDVGETRIEKENRNMLEPKLFNHGSVSINYSKIFDYFPHGVEFVYYNQEALILSSSLSILEGLDLAFTTNFIQERLNGSKTTENFLQYGASLQFNLLREKSSGKRFYIESGLVRGNLCTCGDEQSYKREGLNYLKIGGGYDQNLIKNKLFLKIYASKSLILNDKAETGAYLIPQLGLQYNW